MIPANVLVVEDERVVAMHLRQQLSRLGYRVPAIATAGEQALAHIMELRPDVVLMDIHIEGDIDGIETAARIPQELQTPVIYLTAYSEEATLERARSTRPYGYLLKPFSERELHAVIQMVLERRRADSLAAESAQRLEHLVDERTAALVMANREIERQTVERLKMERALYQAQKMEAVGQLTGGIAHDFNNLMQVVIGNLDVLTQILPPELALPRRIVDVAMRGARQAVSVTQRLLAFSSRQALAPKPVSVNALVTGMLDLMSRALGETIKIEVAVDAEVWLVEVDPNQLENAILNLAVNSRDAMPDGGQVVIETQNARLDESAIIDKDKVAAGDYVLISVSDKGCGMPQDTLARVFEPFFTTKQPGKGTGLGLSQVYGFVKQSGGHVKVYSEPEQGTTVKIYLPRLATDAPDNAEAVPRSSIASKGTETILVVEDSPEVRAFTVQALTALGYKVLETYDGPSALMLLSAAAGHVDLLFTDVVLPSGMNGAVLAAQAVAANPGLKVLFTTGYARDAIVHHGRLDAGVELINKPFTTSELAARVRGVLDGHQKPTK